MNEAPRVAKVKGDIPSESRRETRERRRLKVVFFKIDKYDPGKKVDQLLAAYSGIPADKQIGAESELSLASPAIL